MVSIRCCDGFHMVSSHRASNSCRGLKEPRYEGTAVEDECRVREDTGMSNNDGDGTICKAEVVVRPFRRRSGEGADAALLLVHAEWSSDMVGDEGL